MTRAAELREIAHRLLRLADAEEPNGPPEGGKLSRLASAHNVEPIYLERLAEALLRIRRLRENHFAGDLFADPAWDILLDLFIHGSLGQRVPVTSACIASNVPQATALRWLGMLEDRGLISREDDPSDRRRTFVALTRQGESAVTQYLVDARRYVRLTHLLPFMLVESRAS